MMKKKSVLKYGFKQGIARKLIVYLLVFSSFVTLILTSVQLYLEYSKDRQHIDNEFEIIKKSHLESMATSLWSFDENLLAVQLEGVLQMHDMQYIEIRPNVGKSLSAGTIKQSNVIRREFNLSFLYKEKKIPVGTLVVDISLSGVYTRLIDRISIILLSQTIKTFLVSSFIFFIFYSLVTRYLNVVVNYVSDLDINQLNTKLTLNRKQKKTGEPDELDELVAGINKMRNNLLIDITKQTQIEEALRQSENDLKASQQIAHLGSWRLDLSTNQVIWSEELYKMYGFDPTLPVPPYTEHMRLFTPESWGILSNSLAITSESGTPYELELETVRADGSNGWMWVRGEAIADSAGNITNLLGAAQDITERKQGAERYKKTIESSIDGFWITGMKGEFLEVNEAYSNMIGYRRDELLGMSISDIEVLENTAEIKKRMSSIISNGSERFESQHRHKKGHIIDVDISATYIQDSGGLCFVFLRDITDRIRMEEQLRQAQKMESIGNLAGGIAHDFNNLLFPIIGMSEMLLEDLPHDSLEHENAQEIFNAGKRAGGLVKQILAFSRQSEHKLTPVRIQTILKEVLKLCRSTIPANIELKEDIDLNCGLIMGDPTQIHQVAMNLITNAFHAIEEKNGIIDVTLKKIQFDKDEIPGNSLLPGQYINLSITDDGTGMPHSVQKKIFDPYFTTKNTGKGTGLGLAVVYGIVKEHKGEINVYSEEGRGTTFNVYLPLMKTALTPDLVNQSLTLPTGTENILLVDDEISVARLESQMLSRLGYQVTNLTDSFEALNEFKTNPENFDLVLTDMTMPNMTGDQLAREILSIKPEMPIIICTGFSERVNEDQIRDIGVKGFLMKPVVKYDMAQMVRNVLDATKIL